MTVGLIALVLAAAGGGAHYALPGFSCVNVDEKACAFFGEYFAEHLKEGTALEVTTQQEIAAVIGLERQKQLLGCSEQSATCLAELAGALGVDGLVLGTIAKVGNDFALTTKVVRSRDAKVLGASNRRVRSESELLDTLAAMATELQGRLGVATAVTAPPPGAAAKPFRLPGGAPAWALLGVGVAAGLGGAYFTSAAYAQRDLLHTPAVRTEPELDGLIATGKFDSAMAVTLLAGGGLALAGGATLLTLDLLHPPRVALAPVQGGAVVLVGGSLP